jgi:ABC-type lipoprotein export system ATPase subunit
MSILRTENLSRTYIKGAHRVEAVRNVSLTIEEGEMICILGRSGSGKTSLLNLLGLLDRPTGGALYFQDREIDFRSLSLLTRLRRLHYGFVFQQFNLIPHLSAQENVALPLRYAGIPLRERLRRAQEMLERVGLGERKSFKWEELSGGEAQRVAVARALINRPLLLLADEPTSELDTETSKELLELIADLRISTKTTMFIVSHDAQISSYATRVLEMNDGKIV